MVIRRSAGGCGFRAKSAARVMVSELTADLGAYGTGKQFINNLYSPAGARGPSYGGRQGGVRPAGLAPGRRGIPPRAGKVPITYPVSRSNPMLPLLPTLSQTSRFIGCGNSETAFRRLRIFLRMNLILASADKERHRSV